MKRIALIFLFLIAGAVCYCRQPVPVEHFTRERTYHVLHYKLDLRIDEKQKTCTGDVGITLVPLRPLLDEVRLDAAEMKVSQIKLGQQSLEFHLTGETLFIALDHPYGLNDTVNLTVSYAVSSPKKGMYFVTPDSGYPNKQYQVWTQGEAEDNHYWFPCYDFPNDFSTSEMIVTVKDRYTAIGNGKLIEEKRDPKQHTMTFHWLESKLHASYLISLIVGEYVDVKDSCGTVPISNYVYPSDRDRAMLSFGKTPSMIDFYSTITGYPYPWEKFAQTVVEDFIYGGQENVSAVTLTDQTIHDWRAHLDRTSDGLVAHELAHQWFGDMITCRDWSHAWLNEGFATYLENLFVGHDLGKDDAAKEILDHQISLANVDAGTHRRPTVTNRYVNPMDLFDSRIYGKGAVILNMLRFTLGDELFWKSIRHYTRKFAFQNVETNDFKVAIEEATGYNMHWFFDEWLYKAGCPDFVVSSTWDQSTRSEQLIVKQVQQTDSLTGVFTTPIEIEVWVHGVPYDYRVMISSVADTFSFPAYQQPQLVIFDKGSKILKKVRFQKSLVEWVYQLQHASDGVDRLLAIDELQWTADSSIVLDVLKKAALDDRFWAVRQEAVWALGDIHNHDISETLLAAYGDCDTRVRMAAAALLGNCTGSLVQSTLKHAFESDSSYAVEAAALRSLVKLDSSHRSEYLSEALNRDSYGEVIRATALRELSSIGDTGALRAIKSFTRYGVDRNLRIQALDILAAKWKSNDTVLNYIIGLLNDPSFQMRWAVISSLASIGDPRAIEALERTSHSESDSRLIKAANDAIEKIRQTQQTH